MYEDENNLYHYSYRKGDEQNPNAPIDTKNYAEDPWDKNPGGSPKKKGGSGLSGKIVALALVCARAYYVIFSWDYYSAHPDRILSVRDGGLAIYGGLLGGMLGAFLYARHAKIPFMQLADLAAPALALGQCIGRWGNFVNQEAYGNPVTDPAWQFFPAAVYIEREGGYFQATFFYESAWCFLIVLFLLLAEKRGWFRKRGDEFLAYALLYAVERAVVEGLRSDSLYWGGIRVSQLLSLLIALAIAAYFAIRWLHSRKKA